MKPSGINSKVYRQTNKKEVISTSLLFFALPKTLPALVIYATFPENGYFEEIITC
jgi:hypothetical protein